jgi:uncharacterized membrane protein (DUF373 family)
MLVEKIYVYFERCVASVLLFGTGIVIVFALGAFLLDLLRTFADLDPSAVDYLTFQNLFEGILAVVIALELTHSVQEMTVQRRGVVQLRTVVLIGILAVVRKLIVLDIEKTSGTFLIGLGATVAALGAVYTATYYCTARLAPGDRQLG